MIQLYIKVAIRFLRKNKLYSLLNILGLAIGICSFLLIMLYVNYENSYDKFPGSENVLRVFMDYKEGNKFVEGDAMSYNLSGPTLKDEYPEIEKFARIYRFDKVTIEHNEKILEQENGGIADPSFFEIFDYKLINGQKETALSEPNTIVLTESLAQKIFGDKSALGEIISVYFARDEKKLKVTGVMPDTRKNTHLKLNYLISFDTHKTWKIFGYQQKLNWNGNDWYTYLKIKPNADFVLLQQKVMSKNFHDNLEERHNIQKLEDIHLFSNKPYEAEANGSNTRVKLLRSIAFIILILSWLNFINLSSTKSLERAKEIGIRKVVGAQRPQLIIQFLLESVVINAVAIVIGSSLAYAFSTSFGSFVGKELIFDISSIGQFSWSFGFIILGMLLASVYPAIILSNYKPVKALKGKIRTSNGEVNVRKGLIVTQYAATIILLSGALLISKQINFLKDQPIGVNLNQVLALRGEILDQNTDSLTIHKFKTLGNELEKLPFVDVTSTAETYPGDGYAILSSFMGITLPDGKDDNQSLFYQYQVHPDYFELMGIEFLAGQAIQAKAGNHSIVVNEKCLQQIGIHNISEAVQTSVKFFGQTWTIVGVMKNYRHFGLRDASKPMIIRPGNANENLLVKLNEKAIEANGLSGSIKSIENIWASIFPKSTFNYTFVDTKFEQQYQGETQFSNAINWFTILAMFIAALGLFGLTSYSCIQRRKEIGIRKITGASIANILAMLNVDYLKWILVALIIAVPISWYGMNLWLNNFAARTPIHWWIFLIAGALTLGVTVLTVSWQSYQAAARNPIHSLRDE